MHGQKMCVKDHCNLPEIPYIYPEIKKVNKKKFDKHMNIQ